MEIEIFYTFSTPHFPHSTFSTPLIFHTPHSALLIFHRTLAAGYKRGTSGIRPWIPFLQYVFMNDLFYFLKGVCINAYADDEQIYASDKDPVKLEMRLQCQLLSRS